MDINQERKDGRISKEALNKELGYQQALADLIKQGLSEDAAIKYLADRKEGGQADG